MATKEYTKSLPDSMQNVVLMVSWGNLQNGDDGLPIEVANLADRSIQVVGAFGVGGTVRIEGSLDGNNYSVLTDPQGNNLDITASKIEAVSELVRYIRPRVTAGDGATDLTVHLLMKGK